MKKKFLSLLLLPLVLTSCGSKGVSFAALKAKIDTLLTAFPSIDLTAMGFPKGWENEPLWN